MRALIIGLLLLAGCNQDPFAKPSKVDETVIGKGGFATGPGYRVLYGPASMISGEERARIPYFAIDAPPMTDAKRPEIVCLMFDGAGRLVTGDGFTIPSKGRGGFIEIWVPRPVSYSFCKSVGEDK